MLAVQRAADSQLERRDVAGAALGGGDDDGGLLGGVRHGGTRQVQQPLGLAQRLCGKQTSRDVHSTTECVALWQLLVEQ